MLSRLLIDKGVREYAEAARLIKKEFPEVTFKLAGMLYEGKRSININEIQLLDSYKPKIEKEDFEVIDLRG